MLNVKKVQPVSNYCLKVFFDNNECRCFDVKPYLDKGTFKELKNKNYFNQVKSIQYGIEWPHHQDLSADTLYLEGTKVATKKKIIKKKAIKPKRSKSTRLKKAAHSR